MSMAINDFCKYFTLIIKTKGYDSMQQRENLLISKALIGRLGYNSSTAYKLKIDNVLVHLETQGIKAIEGKPISSDIYTGDEWSISLEPQ